MHLMASYFIAALSISSLQTAKQQVHSTKSNQDEPEDEDFDIDTSMNPEASKNKPFRQQLSPTLMLVMLLGS